MSSKTHRVGSKEAFIYYIPTIVSATEWNSSDTLFLRLQTPASGILVILFLTSSAELLVMLKTVNLGASCRQQLHLRLSCHFLPWRGAFDNEFDNVYNAQRLLLVMSDSGKALHTQVCNICGLPE